MLLDGLFNTKKNIMLKKLADFSALNHKVISNNVANMETPGFTAKKVDFENAFKDAVKTNDIESIAKVESKIVNNYENPYRMDMNNVDVEKELMQLSQNTVRYQLVNNLLNSSIKKWVDIFKAGGS